MKRDAVQMSLLLDYYGSLLTDKQRNAFDLYYNQDFSLTEIAEQEGISRQGVHESILRTEAILRNAEESLGCIRRAQGLQAGMDRIVRSAQRLLASGEPTVRQAAEEILAAAATLKE